MRRRSPVRAARSEGRSLIARNVRLPGWPALPGRHHAGLIFTSDASMPRSHHTIGRSVTALQGVMRANPGDDGFTDRIHWL